MRIVRANFGFHNIQVLIMFGLLIVFTLILRVDCGKKNKDKGKKGGSAGGGDGPEETEAIERLSKVFGIEHAPQHMVGATPPQFMLELFNDITDSGGLIKKGGPYNASTVVSFPDRAYNKEMHFYYNVSMHASEQLLEAEFHLFRMTPLANETRHAPQGRVSHLIEVKVYQVLDPKNMYSDIGRTLVDQKRVSAHARGWFIFNVTRAVRDWAFQKAPNHGFLVISKALYGQDLGEADVRFAQRKAHHDTKQPILVIYTDDGRQRTPHYISPEDQEYKEITRDIRRLEKKYQRKMGYNYDNAGLRNAIKFLNEKEREEYGHPFFAPKSDSENAENNSRNKRSVSNSTNKKRPKRDRKSDQKDKRDANRYSRRRRSCNRRQMYVDFDEIGWAGWIISPKGYNAYHCKGPCEFPLGQSQRPTNHATVQSIVHALRVGKGVTTPCCVPNKLYSISLLYFDDAENVILKQYDDMVAASCGCH
ncbi:bone morphogenetic protein 3-like [Mya arenaria]|uniref:bone morphogenetic protein 3-like n=1 Tax=Mya arenaria TaxID=6604 RepID=UPI0022E5087F|nr:bone morphogenetic protein 3-like [Mya arenaria]